jgi:NAD(P)-dependent dehydrogenase (short-subunit alcohol dehydrogenase family)
MDLGIEDETALVTASSSGLGRASAAAMLDAGANVVVCGRDRERLARAESDLATLAGEVHAVQADITDPDDVERLVAETVGTFGGLDHLVTSAGGPPPGPTREMGDAEWYAAYDLLVMSVVRSLDAAYPYLDESDAGTLTCITSRSVREVIDGLVLSNAVRRAVVGLVKTVSREYAPSIRANAVLPGSHETARIRELVDEAVERGEYDSYEAGLAAWSEDIPLGRVGDPRECGDVVAFLASERASYVTGETVVVDGGRARS